MNMDCSTLLNNEDGNLLVFWADMFLLVVLSFTRPEHAPNHGWQDPATTLANMIRDLQAQVLCDKVIPINFPSGYWMCIQLSKLICNYDRGLTASYKSWQYVKGWGCLCLAVCRQTSISWLDTPGYMMRFSTRNTVMSTDCFVHVLWESPYCYWMDVKSGQYLKRNLLYVHRPEFDGISSDFKWSIVFDSSVCTFDAFSLELSSCFWLKMVEVEAAEYIDPIGSSNIIRLIS